MLSVKAVSGPIFKLPIFLKLTKCSGRARREMVSLLVECSRVVDPFGGKKRGKVICPLKRGVRRFDHSPFDILLARRVADLLSSFAIKLSTAPAWVLFKNGEASHIIYPTPTLPYPTQPGLGFRVSGLRLRALD